MSPNGSATRRASSAAALGEAQRAVEQRMADWGSDIEKLQGGLADELKRVGHASGS